MKWRKLHSESYNEIFARMDSCKLISEMSTPLKKFISSVEFLQEQIIENWCLCKYCQMFDNENQVRNHWIEELHAYLSKLVGMKLKNGIDKSKHVRRLMVDEYELNDKSRVIEFIIGKFKEENISDMDKIESVATQFSSSLPRLIEVISSGNLTSVDEYLIMEFEIDC